MLKTGVILDSRYEDHDVTHAHPERPERIGALLELMQDYDRKGLVRLDPRPATIEQLTLIHDRDYVDRVHATSGQPHVAFDPDTHAFAGTWDTALLAAGGLLELVDNIMNGTVDNGFAMVRPPGHHAETGRAMGFCFFNNVAIAARYLRTVHGLGRILIMDWDVHHGNGTERSFYRDGDVMYVSTHQYPHYPGTGAAEDLGEGEGEGFTVNLPLRGGFGDDEYAACFERIIEPVCRAFDPDFVLISAGFDCHVFDPLSQMRVTDEGFARMARSLLEIAADCSGGKCAAVLEGGYDLTALKESTARVLDVFGGDEPAPAHAAAGALESYLDAIAGIQGRYWPV
jgi:acetoin utilization deacetylase AcuC-like enzyme